MELEYKAEAKIEIKVAIAIPENRDVILKGMFYGFLRFVASIKTPAILLGNDDDELIPGKASYIDNMRNRQIEKAQVLNCSHIFFVDSDTIPPPGALEKLLAADQDIVGGLYRFRVPPYKALAFWYAVNRYIPINMIKDSGQLIPVDAIGMGGTLIRLSILKKLKKPYFKAGYVHYASPYDKSKKREKRYLGEDIYFCEQAHKAGFRIYLHPGVRCDHISQIMIPGNLQPVEFSINSDHKMDTTIISFGG